MNLRSKAAALSLTVCAGAALPAHAVVITFEGIAGGAVTPNGAIEYGSPVLLDGYTFTTLATATNPAQFATWTAASNADASYSNFTGSASLFSNSGTASTMTSSNGGAFSVTSVSVANLYRQSSGGNVVSFVGARAGGGSVTQTYALPAGDALHAVGLAGFDSVLSLTLFTSVFGEPNAYFQFDNIAAQAVPEPASLLMLGAGLMALLALRRRT